MHIELRPPQRGGRKQTICSFKGSFNYIGSLAYPKNNTPPAESLIFPYSVILIIINIIITIILFFFLYIFY